jgi:hypothetical protein
VNAVGLVTLIAGPTRRMCFTPLAPVLNRLGAALLTGYIGVAPRLKARGSARRAAAREQPAAPADGAATAMRS